jgi:alkylation response protein AidB-like acyl-CoA dehydrogenase
VPGSPKRITDRLRMLHSTLQSAHAAWRALADKLYGLYSKARKVTNEGAAVTNANRDPAIIPADRASKRRVLFDAVDSIAPVIAEDAAASETQRYLAPSTLDAFRRSGLLALKVPEVLGGFEADNALQFEVIERVAYHSTAAAWCLFIYADNLGKAGAQLSDRGLESLMPRRVLPLICGGGGLIAGELIPTEGGYLLGGRWIYGSGIAGSDYVMVLGKNPSAPHASSPTFCLVPTTAISVSDNWHVIGLRGTGSSDFSASDVFVPADMTFSIDSRPERGGTIFLLGFMGYVAHMIAAVAIGGAMRALDDVVRMAETKARGYGVKIPLARRGVFQDFVGRSSLTLSAMRAMLIEIGQRIVAEAARLGGSPLAIEIESRAATCLATQQAVEVMNGVLRYAGGEGAREGSSIQRTLRDLNMAQTHYFVSDSALELHGRSRLGEENLNPAA